MKARIKWVDCLRMMAIFSIYLFHMGDKAGRLYPFTNLYHIMLFFFISGFFFIEITGRDEFIGSLCKIVYRIGIPAILFIMINVIFISIRNKSSIYKVVSTMSVYFAMKKGSGVGGLWFLGCFFFISTLHSCVSYLIRNKYIVFFISLVIYLVANFTTLLRFSNHIFASIDLIPQYWVYYSLGSLAFPLLQKFETAGGILSKMLRMALLFVTFLYSVICYFKGTYFYVGNVVIFQLIGTVTIILFFTVSAQYVAKQLRDSSIILKIGRATLVLCATEYMTKQITDDLLNSIGFGMIDISTPIAAIVFSFIFLLFGYLLWFKCIAGIFPILSGHYSLHKGM